MDAQQGPNKIPYAMVGLIATFIGISLKFLLLLAGLYGLLDFVPKIFLFWLPTVGLYMNLVLSLVAVVVIWGWWQAHVVGTNKLGGLTNQIGGAWQNKRGSLALIASLILMMVVLVIAANHGSVWTKSRNPTATEPSNSGVQPNETNTDKASRSKSDSDSAAPAPSPARTQRPAGIVQGSTGPNSPNIIGSHNKITYGNSEQNQQAKPQSQNDDKAAK